MVTQEALKEKALLSYQQGGSDKVYIVEMKEQTLQSGLKGHIVHCHYGRRDGTMNFANKTPSPVSYLSAKTIFDKVVKEKTAKGYRVTLNATESTQATTSGAPLQHPMTYGHSPQLLNSVKGEEDLESMLSDDEWVAQEKMDGERRMIARRAGWSWIGINKKGGPVSLPEMLIKAMASSGLPDDITLDGEIIGDIYYVFDVPHWEEALDEYPFFYRAEFLDRITENANIRVVKVAIGKESKQALLKKIKATNGEGIVLKRAESVYEPGRPNSGGDQLKYKFVESATVVVSRVNQGKRSVAFGAFDDGRAYHDLGNVTIQPNQEIPEKGSFIEVRYLYAYKGGSLYQPVYLGKRSDQLMEDCTLSQLKYKSVLETIPVESSQDSRWAW